jgi:hypothetical protein
MAAQSSMWRLAVCPHHRVTSAPARLLSSGCTTSCQPQVKRLQCCRDAGTTPAHRHMWLGWLPGQGTDPKPPSAVPLLGSWQPVLRVLLISIQTHKLASSPAFCLVAAVRHFCEIQDTICWKHLLGESSRPVQNTDFGCCLSESSLRSHRLPLLSNRGPRHFIDRCDLRDNCPLKQLD